MRESSNPVFRSLPKGQQGGYAQFGTGAGGYGAQAVHADPYAAQPYQDQRAVDTRPLTIDDVVTKTAMTLGVVTVVGIVSYFLVVDEPRLDDAVRASSAAWAGWRSSGRDIRSQAGQPGDRAGLRRIRGPVRRRGVVLDRQPGVLRWPRDDCTGDRRHDRCVRRHARRLQDRRDPRHAEAHPDARCRRCSACSRWLCSTSCSRCSESAAAQGFGLRTVVRSQSSSRWSASVWRRSCSCSTSTRPTS